MGAFLLWEKYTKEPEKSIQKIFGEKNFIRCRKRVDKKEDMP
jgi:hypothetical protein